MSIVVRDRIVCNYQRNLIIKHQLVMTLLDLSLNLASTLGVELIYREIKPIRNTIMPERMRERMRERERGRLS